MRFVLPVVFALSALVAGGCKGVERGAVALDLPQLQDIVKAEIGKVQLQVAPVDSGMHINEGVLPWMLGLSLFLSVLGYWIARLLRLATARLLSRPPSMAGSENACEAPLGLNSPGSGSIQQVTTPCG